MKSALRPIVILSPFVPLHYPRFDSKFIEIRSLSFDENNEIYLHKSFEPFFNNKFAAWKRPILSRIVSDLLRKSRLVLLKENSQNNTQASNNLQAWENAPCASSRWGNGLAYSLIVPWSCRLDVRSHASSIVDFRCFSSAFIIAAGREHVFRQIE